MSCLITKGFKDKSRKYYGDSHGKVPKLRKRNSKARKIMEIQPVRSSSLLLQQLWLTIPRILKRWSIQLHSEIKERLETGPKSCRLRPSKGSTKFKKKREDYGNSRNQNKEQRIVTYWSNSIGNRRGSFAVQGKPWHKRRSNADDISISNRRHNLGRYWNRINSVGILLFATLSYHCFRKKARSTKLKITDRDLLKRCLK